MITAMVTAGCGGSDNSGGSEAKNTDPIAVGVAMSLTGPFAPIGNSEVRGIELAVNEINDAGGIDGRKIELTKLDDASDPTRAATNVRQLIGDGVVAVLGPTTGSTLGGALPLTTRQNVLEIVGVGPDFAGAAKVPANLFTVPPPVQTWIDGAVCYLDQVVHAKRVAGLFTPDAAGTRSAQAFPASLKKAGMELVSTQQVALDATNTAVQWTQIRDSNPDAVLDWTTGAVGGKTLVDAKALGVDVPILGYVSWGLPAVLGLAGPAADGVNVLGHITAQDPKPGQEDFVQAFQKAYPDQQLDHFAAYGYDMVQVLKGALADNPNATQQDGKKLSQSLEDSDPIQGVVAKYDFDDESKALGAHSGVKAKDIALLVAQGGQFQLNPQQLKCS